jgi:predicted Rossmann fold flavoprotein
MKVAIVGGGISGFVSALKINGDITIYESNSEPLKKLSVTGNGRCNFLNDDMNLDHYHSESNINDYIKDDIKDTVLDFINELEIAYKIKNGYYYPLSNKATTIKNVLIYEAHKKNVNILLNEKVHNIEKIGNEFIINGKDKYDKVIISSGLGSYPQIGASTDGIKFASNMKHEIVPILPSLVPLTTEQYDWDGIRSDARISLFVDGNKIHTEEGEIQLTSYGISGICVFNVSRYASIALANKQDVYVCINFVPSISNIYTYLNNTKNTINIVLKRMINDKLANIIMSNIDIPRNKTFSELTEDEKVILINELTNFKLYVTGTMNYNQSQVTRGGVSLTNIDSNFESKIVPGLYFTGEVLDVDGDCGGYNIAFAIYSAIKASRGINND